MEAIPIAIFWSIALWCLLQRKQALLYLFFASMPFGSFAVIPTQVTGGLTLTPTPIVALMLIARELGSMRALGQALDMALRRSGLLLLFAFWVVAGVVTLFMPRFFAGMVEVVPVRAGALSDTTLLVPTTQNFSQLIYVSISVLAVFAFARLLQADEMRRHALAALLLGAALTALTGALDLASQYVPIGLALELFRTASYELLTDVEVLSAKRVVGLTPEASSYGALALTFLAALYFFRRAMPAGFVRRRLVPALMGVLLLLIWLSTSSAAYLGLGLFGAAAAADWCFRLAAPVSQTYLRRGLAGEFALAVVTLCVLLMIVLAKPGLLAPMREMFDLMVLQKSSSSSFEERSMWTHVSLNALFATHGLGVGLGGTRASNFAVALASNAGVLGAALYFLFVLQCLAFRNPARGDAKGVALLSGIRWTYLPAFFTGLMIGTTPDFGLFNAFLFGFATAITCRRARTRAALTPSASLQPQAYVQPMRPRALRSLRAQP
ncbi:hypothetical protein QTH91_02445 [Variovorax dokdonensis]|uniref:Uncharacterized protein n=1 Tax=Variovorax dokdonensis TaxID=344883 RepID=A0ABT7N5V2_9BURK|nr:hypothetical protein [Variovorax dokdonensis]MDM0043331.1 hypothetical protein [Variovorax dokdonensis]